MHSYRHTRIVAAIAGLALAAAAQAQAQAQAQDNGATAPPAAAADSEIPGNRAMQSSPARLLTDPRNQLRDDPAGLPPGVPEGPIPILVPELIMMALPRTEVSGLMQGAGLPDPKYANTRFLSESAFGHLSPVDVLRGFDELLGSPPLPNGFLFHGTEMNAMGGSFGRGQALVQVGQQAGDLSIFGAFGGLTDDGWQQQSSTRLQQYHGDFGYRSGDSELHLTAHYLSNDAKGGGVTVTPVDLLETDWTAQSTYPNTNDVRNLLLDFTGKFALDGGWTAHSDMSFGRLIGKQESTQETNPSLGGCPDDSTLLCTSSGEPYLDINGQQFSNVLEGAADRYYAYNDHVKTSTKSWGVTVGLAKRGLLWGRPNNFAAGVTYNGGKSIGSAHHYVGILNSDGGMVSIVGESNTAPGGVPQEVSAKVDYTNVYAANVLDVSPKLKVGVGGRFTYSVINQKDLMGTSTDLNETRVFNHLAPSVGVTYAFAPGLIAYGGYREAARVVTPFGVSCESSESVCNAETPWFAGDSILEQSIVRNYQLGLRGQLRSFNFVANPVQVAWNAGLYRTNTSHYYYLATKTSRPEATDVGNIRVQGAKLGMEIMVGKLTTSINYTYTDARFRSSFSLGTGINTAAVDYKIYVTPGKVIPAQPAHSLKVVAKYDVTGGWSIGTSLRSVSKSYYIGDEVNAMGTVPGYFAVSFNTNYRVNSNLELFGIIENALNKKYASFGLLQSTSHKTSNSRSWMVGQPFSVYGGLRYKF